VIWRTAYEAHSGLFCSEIRTKRSSGAYEPDLARMIEENTAYVLRCAATDAKQLALVFDIDETSLSSWDEINANDLGFIPHATCDQLPKGPCGVDAWQRSVAPKAMNHPKSSSTSQEGEHRCFFITGRVDYDNGRRDVGNEFAQGEIIGLDRPHAETIRRYILHPECRNSRLASDRSKRQEIGKGSQRDCLPTGSEKVMCALFRIFEWRRRHHLMVIITPKKRASTRGTKVSVFVSQNIR
jgi:hypothetical protein